MGQDGLPTHLMTGVLPAKDSHHGLVWTMATPLMKTDDDQRSMPAVMVLAPPPSTAAHAVAWTSVSAPVDNSAGAPKALWRRQRGEDGAAAPVCGSAAAAPASARGWTPKR
jgi:hypothetical protein